MSRYVKTKVKKVKKYNSINEVNAYETTLTAVEPTADNTVSLPNSSGTLATEGDALAFGIVFGG